jgi:hypothetical protein
LQRDSGIFYRVIRKLAKPFILTPSAEGNQLLSNKIIGDLVMDDKPFMVGRLGSSEMAVVLTYLIQNEPSALQRTLHIIRGGEVSWTEQLKNDLCNRSGFFCNKMNELEKLAKLYLECLSQSDVLGSWLPGEKSLTKQLSGVKQVAFDDLKPFFTKTPWTKTLHQKKVLVVHPFAKTIKYQYENNRKKLHNNNLLPDFELTTHKGIQSMGESSSNRNEWFDNLKKLEDEISDLNFDIALIGLGAYGFPLAVSIKKMGRIAMHLGGMLQLMFGIKGLRWDRIPLYSNLYNDNWVYPSPEETPKNRHFLEKGAYWKE